MTIPEAAAHGGWEALEQLVALLADVDARDDRAAALATLREVARSPRLVVALDEHVRAVPWRLPYHSPHLTRLADRLHRPAPGPIAVAVASSHGDGRVRERAVRAMTAAPDPALVPFLVLRTTDWVPQVRDAARAGLALLLADDAAPYLAAALPSALRVGDRWRGGFAVALVTAAALAAPPEVRRELAAAGPVAQRRLMADLGRAHGRLSADDLLTAARSDPDPVIAVRAAEHVARDAVWAGRVRVLQRLAGSRRPHVRGIGLTGLMRLGHGADVVAHLDDPASLVRPIAREAARRAGIDTGAHYRTAVAGDAVTPGSVAGLAETGTTADAPLLHPLLEHPAGAVRAAAVRGLATLGPFDAERLVPLLRDPAAAVVRECAAALRPYARDLPAALPDGLLADARPELRRAGYRLSGARSAYHGLWAALVLLTDPHPGLARRAGADAVRRIREAQRRPWPDALPPAQRDALRQLASRRAGVLGPELTGELVALLPA